MSEWNRETSETEQPESPKTNEVSPDPELSKELDDSYESYVDSGRKENFEQPENEEWETEKTEEDSDSLEDDLNDSYESYLRDREGNAEKTDIKTGELSEEDRAQLREKTGWSEDVVNAIDTHEQAEIYEGANLHPETVNGRECLVKDVDMNYVDEKTGMTNRERMAKGRSPIDAATGEKIELHHMGQDYDAPFAELTENSEHGNGNHSTLHPKHENSWRNDKTLENQYNQEKKQHWMARSKEGETS